MNPIRRAAAAFRPYGLALAFLIAALVLRAIIDPWLGERQQLSLLFGAVALAVWYGGVAPAVVTTVLGYFASDYFFIEPRGVFAVREAHQVVSLLTYLGSCAVIVIFGEGLRRGRREATALGRQLQEKQRQLEEQERHKDQFLATLGHELRTPLSPLRNAVKVLQRQGRADADLRRVLDIIDRQVNHMVHLVDDLLDLSRVKAGRLRLTRESIDLASVVSEAIDTIRPALQSRGHTLAVSMPDSPMHLTGDPTRLRQVFLNILGNAVKYTPPGGHIRLAAAVEMAETVVSVQDDGLGIDQEKRGRLFGLYDQMDRPPEETQGGLGIGLALVHRIVSGHGGRIDVRSEGEGRGSEFIVRLPSGISDSAPARTRARL